MGGRLAVLISLFLAAYGALIFRLYDLQVQNGAYYEAKAASQEFAASFLEAKRGALYLTDKGGDTLAVAINKNFPVVYAVPDDILDPERTANLIAPLLGEEPDAILKKLVKKNDKYELLGEKISEENAAAVDALKVKGIYVIAEPRRFYPFGSMAAHLLGFVGLRDDGAGREGHYGLEEFYEERLAGVSGTSTADAAAAPVAGEDVVLTIDFNIQREAERVLGDAVRKYEATGGMIIVEDPETGKLLALAALPNFDPNNYRSSPLEAFLNPAIQQVYEPGSVFKVITMAGGLDSGAVTPQTTFVDSGKLTISGRTIENFDYRTHGARGESTMSNVLEYSMNTGAVFVERRMGRELFRKYVERFGFGEKTGVGLLGEVKSDIRRLNSKEKDIAFATASYGQGVAVTPLALINAISAVANGGTLMRPYLDAAIEPQVIRPVVSEDAAKKATAMMISAVDKAKAASIAGYAVAGKTGTAYVPDFEKGGYTDQVINTYAGFVPATDPKATILVRLDKPAGGPLAGATVVPAFREMAEFVINYYTIPPDRLQEAPEH